ncbi:MAG: hypothetical protein WBG86_15165, partial [Polyangiales bacterium]
MPTRDEESSEASTQEPPRRPAGGGLRRLLLIVLLSVVGVASLGVVAGAWLLNNLDHPWVKGKVEYALSSLVGTDIRYAGLSVSPGSGLHLRELVVATPEALRPHAQEMLRLEELRVPIRLRALLSGNVLIGDVEGGPIEVTVVITDDGRNSFGELVQSEDVADEAQTPFSQSLEALEQLSLVVGSVRLAPIRVSTLEVTRSTDEPGDALVLTRQADLEPLGIFSDGVSFERAPEGAVVVRPHGRDDVALSVVEPLKAGSNREARLAPNVEVRLENNRILRLNAHARLLDQSLFPELRPVRSIVELESSASFDPDQSQTVVKVDTLTLLDSMLVATANVALHDAVPRERDDAELPRTVVSVLFAKAQVDGHGTLDVPSLPWVLSWLDLSGLHGRFEIEGVDIGPTGVSHGTGALEGRLDHARYSDGPVSLTLSGATWNGAVSAPNDPADTLGGLAVEGSVDEVRVKERGSFGAAV